MGKISLISSKYIVHTSIQIDGVVDRPDVIGAIFGQTEGLLGEDLELRELQRSGRIGRIEVKLEIKVGKSTGAIIIPSSLDKAETVIIAAALETIQRIGPCNAKVRVIKIEDVRITKRASIIERAKELLKELTDSVLPDSQEITDEVAHSIRMMEIMEWGPEKLAAGPAIEESEEIIVVEGRADVLTLLKHGFKNAIALNGTSVPPSIIPLCNAKTVTVFVDGDRGGDLIIKELAGVAEIDFVIKAPDGKEVEELTKKEIHKALRSKVAFEQAKDDHNGERSSESQGESSQRFERPQFQRGGFQRENRFQRPQYGERPQYGRNGPRFERTERAPFVPRKPALSPDQSAKFKKLAEDLVGTRGAYLLDSSMTVLGKVPAAEIATTVTELKTNVDAIVIDGIATQDVVSVAERANVKYIIAKESEVRSPQTRVNIVTNSEL